MDQQNPGEAQAESLTGHFAVATVQSPGVEKMVKKKIPIEGSPPLTNDLALWLILIFAFFVIGGTVVRVILWL